MAQLAAHYVLLDRVLANYGPEASDARAALRTELAYQLEGTRPMERRSKRISISRSGTQMSVTVPAKTQALSPEDESQRFLKQECLNVVSELAATRWLLFSQIRFPFPDFCWLC